MRTQIEIDFQSMTGTREIRAAIAKQAELEQRYSRVTACRVVLNGPGGHHNTGGLYEANIHMALPNDRAVNVERTGQAGGRHSELISDAFKRARRRQDQARGLQGRVKRHEDQPVGRVTRLDAAGAFGFLESSDDEGNYFQRNKLLYSAFSHLAVGSLSKKWARKEQ
jgi:hypothetical protein